MDPDLLRIALRAILAAWVAEIPDQFLFLGVDRDHRLLFRQSRGHLGVDVAKLRIPVGMAIALRGLAVALQAVARIVEQSGDQGAAHRVALRLERWRQSTHTLAGPPQRRSRVTARRRLDQRFEIPQQGGILGDRGFASRSRPPNALRGLLPRQFLQPPPDRARCNPGRHRDRRNPSITRGERLGRRDQTTAPFVKKRRHRQKTALEWARHRSQPPYMVSKDGCKLYIHSIRSRFDNFRSGPKLPTMRAASKIADHGGKLL